MGLRKLNSTAIVVVIVLIIFSITGIAIFLGNRSKPITIIEINHVSDFYQRYHFPGKGTEEEPYIIEGYRLSGNKYHNIKISLIKEHFIIRNCVVENSNKGIELIGCENAKIINNTIRNNDFGIWNGEGIIKGNLFSNNFSPIAGSVCCRIQSNIFNNSKSNPKGWNDGIRFSSYETIIEDNIFNSFGKAIVLDRGRVIQVKNNSFRNCDFGVIVNDVTDCKLTFNTAINCTTGFTIIRSEEIELLHNNSTKNRENGFNIDTAENCLIEGNNGSGNGDYGILMKRMTNGDIRNNYFERNNASGLCLWVGDYYSINNNSCSNNNIGIELSCVNNTSINYNKIETNKEYGIVTSGTNATIWNNNFINNNNDNNPTITSQAKAIVNGTGIFDEKYYGYPEWYKKQEERGNYWSELVWAIGIEYLIDPGNCTDSYPLEKPIMIDI